jgi:hypothetical protein
VTEDFKPNGEFLTSLDRRVSEHDARLATVFARDVELAHEIKQLLERINQGVSPSVNAVRQENSEIKLSLADLRHKFEIDMIEMKTMTRESVELTRSMLHNFQEGTIQPIQKEVGFMKKTFIYGLVGAFIVFIGEKGLNAAWDKFFEKQRAPLSAPTRGAND